MKRFIYRQMRRCKNMIKQSALSAICLAAILVTIISCQKDGELREAPQVTDAFIRVISSRTNPVFSVFVDDKLLGDSLGNNGELRTTIVKTDGSQHFVVKELSSNTILVDTMVVLARPDCVLSVLESDTTAPPLLFVSGGSDIPEDSARLAFYVGDPGIPTPVDLYLYQSDWASYTLDTVPVHIYRNLNNYSVTDFITVDMSHGEIGYSILVKYSGTDQLVPGITNNTGVMWDNPGSGVRVSICVLPGSGPSNVHNIARLVKSGNFYLTGCMISF